MDILGCGPLRFSGTDLSFRRFVIGLGSCPVLFRTGMVAQPVCILRRLPMSHGRAAVCGGSPQVSIGTVTQGRGDCLPPLQVHGGGTLAGSQPNQASSELIVALIERASAIVQFLRALRVHDLTLDPMCSDPPGSNGPAASWVTEVSGQEVAM